MQIKVVTFCYFLLIFFQINQPQILEASICFEQVEIPSDKLTFGRTCLKILEASICFEQVEIPTDKLTFGRTCLKILEASICFEQVEIPLDKLTFGRACPVDKLFKNVILTPVASETHNIPTRFSTVKNLALFT